MKARSTILDEVFAAFGSASKLAAHLGVSRQAVYHWKAVPIKYLREINRVTGIPKPKLRPDLYD